MPSLSSMVSALQGIADDITLLIRQEFTLAKTEIRENIAAMQAGVGAMLVAGIAALVGVLLLIEAIVFGLAEIMPAGFAALLVGLAMLLLAAGAFFWGRARIANASLLPDRTIRSVRRQAEHFKETL